MRASSLLTSILAVVASLGLSACGKSDSKKTGTAGKASLALTNTTGTAALTAACLPTPGNGEIPDQCWTPSVFELKMIAVRISKDAEGSTSGASGLIWSNKACPTRTSDFNIGTGDDMKVIQYDVQDACDDGMITDYFDFARPTATVNADLNAQDHAIPPGTYNFVQMDFCIGAPKSNNLMFQADGMTAPMGLENKKCGTVSDAMESPAVVGEGEAVTISLAYDLTDTIYQKGPYKDPAYCYVSDDAAVVRCVSDFRALKPSFVKR